MKAWKIGNYSDKRVLTVNAEGKQEQIFDIDELRDVWFLPSYQLDALQSGDECARMRFNNYKKQPLRFALGNGWKGSLEALGLTADRKGRSDIRAAIIREKGVNGDREMAYSLYLAGFDVKDVHMSDLMSGRETLEDINLIVFCGGFSHSDVLGSAKGWASGFRWNNTARQTLRRDYRLPDTLSLGICNVF